MLGTSLAPVTTPITPMSLNRHLKLTDIAPLLNFMTLCRKEPDEWAFIYASVTKESTANLGEVAQVLEYNLADNRITMLRLDETREILVVAGTRGKKHFTVIENDIQESLEAFDVRIISNQLTEKGIQQLEKIIAGFMPRKDLPANLAMRRLVRHSNVFMVLDDDLVVLHQMNHMLKSYGHVETFATARDFLTAYSKYAPNAVFLDIHLKGDKGTDVSAMITEKIDPGAHVVMISADAVKPTILESKFRGAKGFIGKPVKMDMLCVMSWRRQPITRKVKPPKKSGSQEFLVDQRLSRIVICSLDFIQLGLAYAGIGIMQFLLGKGT